jgi:hypothetical protein
MVPCIDRFNKICFTLKFKQKCEHAIKIIDFLIHECTLNGEYKIYLMRRFSNVLFSIKNHVWFSIKVTLYLDCLLVFLDN